VIVTVHPPFTDLRSIQTLIEADRMKIELGAQNCHWENEGAFTGEVAPPMLAKLDVKYVIVGHSERREYFGETDETVNKKAKAVIAQNMTPIVCCGETLEEREAGGAEAKVEGQIRAGLAGIGGNRVGALVLAYEPIWAIGTGRTATADDAQAMCGHIRNVVRSEFGADAADAVRIQYGGSVKPGNIAELMGQADIDGALVGGASLEPDEFAAIVQYRSH
jgi:triosephosphate isomerase